MYIYIYILVGGLEQQVYFSIRLGMIIPTDFQLASISTLVPLPIVIVT